MALTAALAAAVAAVCAAAATGFAPALVALLLVPGVALTAARPGRRVVAPPWVAKWLPIAGAALGFAVLLSLRTPRPSRYLILLAVALSLLWPQTVRMSLFVTAACLLGAGPSLSAVALPLAGFAAASAVVLVAANRTMGTKGGPWAGPGPGRGRGTAVDAATLLAIAGLVALLAAALLPSPDTANRPSAGRSPGKPRARASAPAAPYLQPTDELDAGGPGTGKGDQIVFRVTAPRTALWRTMTFDEYDGRTWRRSPQLSPAPARSGPNVFVPGGPTDEPDYRQPPLVQRIRIEAPAVGVLPAAARLLSVELPGQGGAAVAPDGTVQATPQLGKGATYIATSYVPGPPRAAPTGEDVPPELAAQYLGFPALPERVAQLAREIVSGAGPTAYAKAQAVEGWFRANTDVAAGTPALAPGADPIEELLFTERRGSSQQAASAMAVMLRALRIPARLAVGYVSPRPFAVGGEMTVRARHAHAWVEAWLAGAGWVAFDPAGRFTAPGQDVESLWSRLKRLVAALWWVLAVVVAALALWLGSRLWRKQRLRRSRPWATQAYERIAAAGEKRGRPRRPAETPIEYCAALGAEVGDGALAVRLARVGALVTAAAWSPCEPPDDERAWADDVVRDLQASPGSKHVAG